MAKILTIRVTDEEISVLENLAERENLVKSNGEFSLGLAIKFLIKNASKNREDFSQMNKVLEQIHILLPQMFFQILLASQASIKNLKTEEIEKLKGEIMESIFKICGGFQEITYAKNDPSIDWKNMFSLPILREQNKWKI